MTSTVTPRPRALPAPMPGRTGWPWTPEPRALDVVPPSRPWPRISLVTPSFNQGAFLEVAIRSILLQGYPDLEFIVVDGGSTDGSVDVIKKYEPWLTRWSSGPDGGPAQALNRGFTGTTGEILGFLNADDFYLPGALAKMAAEFARRPAVDVLSGHGYHATPAGALGTPIYSDPWNATRFLYGTCVLVQQSTFFRRRVFERIHGFNEGRRTSWDMELWADLARAGAAFHVFDEFLAAFRLHGESFTGNRRFAEQARQDTHEILESVRGRPESRLDRAVRLVHRVRKFSVHPLRTIRQRLFFHDVLGRWSL